jgi:hypothetical protein
MSVRVFYDILNQKGTPAMYTDTFANRPAYGYQGRLFISTDSGQIFEDTGSAWTLVADAGVGGGTLSSVCLNGNTTATGIVITAGGLSSNSITNTSNTAGSVLFAGTSGLESQSNSTFFWDNTNKRLGIGNASPGAPLDIHGTGTQIQVNGTGSSNSYIQFQNAGVSKWRIGNTYSAGANSFDIYNNGLTTTALSINSTTNNATFSGSIFTNNGWIALKENIGTANTSTYLTLNASSTGGTIESLILGLSAGTIMSLNFPTSSNYGYTFPSASGTIALTSQIPSVSGTTNYISKFTASTTLGNSLIYDDGTNVTIGSTQSLNRLTVQGGTFTASTSNSYALGIANGGGNDLTLGTAATYGAIQTWSTIPLVLQAQGNNLLIGGTTDAGYKLDVTGTGRFTGALTGLSSTFSSSVQAGGVNGAVKLTLQNSDNTGYMAFSEQDIRMWRPNGSGADLTIATQAISGTLGSGKIIFQTENVERARIYTTYSSNTYGSLQVGTNATAKIIITGNSAATGDSAVTLYGGAGSNSVTGSALFQIRANDTYAWVFQIDGSNQLATFYNNGSTWAKLGYQSTSGVWTPSDERRKTNIEDLEYGLKEVLQLKPKKFHFKHDTEVGNIKQKDMGFIAQEVLPIMPLAVDSGYDGEEQYYSMSYGNMIPTLVKAIQELNEKLERNNIN